MAKETSAIMMVKTIHDINIPLGKNFFTTAAKPLLGQQKCTSIRYVSSGVEIELDGCPMLVADNTKLTTLIVPFSGIAFIVPSKE